MKLYSSILLTILLTSTLCQAQSKWKTQWLKEDKPGHIVYSMGLTIVGIQVAKKLNMRNPELAGALFSLTVGMAKEFLMDVNPSPYDIAANTVGIGIAIPVNRCIEKRYKNRKKNKT
jgi:uncharacterized protein YfiM (DUF2279 family)